METVISIANDASIRAAAELLRRGETVAFPTETVYGLGADALNPRAVEKIFVAKGRPSNNPLIVHVSSIEQAKSLVTRWPDSAEVLASALWPGPVTLVLPKTDMVPHITTAGGNTVGIRFPAHPVARALIEACGFPLAAPSANRSNYISPTTAEHVKRSLNGRIPLILDGGASDGGIESTVLDLSKDEVRILRPGLFSANFLSGLLGEKIVYRNEPASTLSTELLSPGQLPIHYAPNTPLILVGRNQLLKILGDLDNGPEPAESAAIMVFDNPALPDLPIAAVVKRMPAGHKDYARVLFSTLHELDSLNPDVIYCELPPSAPDWAGVLDRLSRASSKRS